MMNFTKRSLAIFLIISMFFLSSCEVYETLYPKPAPTGEVISPGDLSMENPESMETSEEELEPLPTEEIVEEMEELEVVKTDDKPIVVVVQETDLVSLSPTAEDPDKESSLVFTFTSPLSDKGEWQTNYGDAGEYTVTVTVSDGESTTARDVLVIVNKREETPTIDSFRPIESGLQIDETQALEFEIEASDLNKDMLSFAWKLDGSDVGTESSYSYQSTYDDAGTHTVKVEVSDGLSSATKIWSVGVNNVNRKPVLEQLQDITMKETDEVVITALATDDDEDPITYSISDERFEQDENVFTWKTEYDSAGTYEITVSASDGQDVTEQTINVAIENVNRPPVITDIVQKK